MGRINLFNFSAILMSVCVGFYTGVRFFEPIVVERLREDGNLRPDMQFPEYDDEGNPILREVEELKAKSELLKAPEAPEAPQPTKSIAYQVKEIEQK